MSGEANVRQRSVLALGQYAEPTSIADPVTVLVNDADVVALSSPFPAGPIEYVVRNFGEVDCGVFLSHVIGGARRTMLTPMSRETCARVIDYATTSVVSSSNVIAQDDFLLGLDPLRYQVPFWSTAPIAPAAPITLAAPAGPAEMLAAIRSRLSLSITDLAAALEVKRPTIYSWIEGSAEPKQKRVGMIQSLHRVAERWASLSTQPVGVLLTRVDDQGLSLRDRIRRREFDAAFSWLATLAAARSTVGAPATRSKLRGLLLKHGLDHAPNNRHAIDAESGKRIDNE
jgi:hypothetical protein